MLRSTWMRGGRMGQAAAALLPSRRRTRTSVVVAVAGGPRALMTVASCSGGAESHRRPVSSGCSFRHHRNNRQQLHFFSTLVSDDPSSSSSRIRARFSSLAALEPIESDSDDDDDDENRRRHEEKDDSEDAARRRNERPHRHRQQQQQQQHNSSSTLPRDRHCETCTCEQQQQHSSSSAPCGDNNHDNDNRDELLKKKNAVVAEPETVEPGATHVIQQPAPSSSSSSSEPQPAPSEEQPEPPPPLAPCGAVQTEYDPAPFPPPLPEPKYSVRRRLLLSPSSSSSSTSTSSSGPSPIAALQSATGRERLVESLQQGTAAAYIALTQHFLNQSEPAYCGLTTACMVLNALELDLVWRWKGGWRYYADENVVLQHCRGCWSKERLQRAGITADEFQRLVSCHGLDSTFKRPFDRTSAAAVENDNNNNNNSENGDGGPSAEANSSDNNKNGSGSYSLEEFRSDVQTILTDTTTTSSSSSSSSSDDESKNYNNSKGMGILVVSFCRATLGQTGDGHFSPVAAYHAASDSVLVLDVARYKYPPYWVPVEQMYRAMQPRDSATRRPRGWYLLYNKMNSGSSSSSRKAAALGENRRPAHLVPVVGRDDHPCPMHTVQVQFCPNQEHPSRKSQGGNDSFSETGQGPPNVLKLRERIGYQKSSE